MLALVLAIMVVLLLLGFPMLVPLAAAAVLLLVLEYGFMTPAVLVQQMIGGVKPAVLTAVPLFIFAADVMTLSLIHI